MDAINFFISNFEVKDAWRLFLKILAFVPVLLLVAAFNLRLDPAGLYRKMVSKYERYEYHIAQALATGKKVMVIHPIDHRILQKYFIENLTTAPDIVVLGSSHSMWLGDNIFSNKKIVNNSVPSAVLADYLGIFDGYAKKNLYPQRVIFLLDPQLIGFPIDSEEWLSIKEDTYDMLDRIKIRSKKIEQPVVPQAWLNIFSFSYFQESIRELHNSYRQQNYFGVDDTASRKLILKDGRCVWGIGTLSRNTKKNGKMVVRKFQNEWFVHTLRYRMKPDKELEDILESFIRYLMGHNIQVTLCLLPLHPQHYEGFLELQKSPGAFDIIGLEHYYHSFAKKLNLEIIGSYDPATCNLGESDFYDGDHIRSDVFEKMFKQKGTRCSMTGI